MAKGTPKFISICGKTSDMCGVTITDKDNNEIVSEDNYVPDFLDEDLNTDNDGGGDYIQLTIDIETGQIQNWDKMKKHIDPYITKLKEEQK